MVFSGPSIGTGILTPWTREQQVLLWCCYGVHTLEEADGMVEFALEANSMLP